MTNNHLRHIALLTILTLLSATCLLPVAAADTIDDISEDHWAYESVRKLVDRGYLSLYADDTFRGEEPVSRYTLADVVARILEEIERKGVVPETEDLKLLREVSIEFRGELVDMAVDLEEMEDRLTELEKRDQVLHTRQAEFRDELQMELGRLEGDIEKTLKQLVLEMDERDMVSEDYVRDRMIEVSSRLDGLEEKILELAERDELEEGYLELLAEQEDRYMEKIRALERQHDNLRREFAEYQQDREETPDRSNLSMYAIGGLVLLLIAVLST